MSPKFPENRITLVVLHLIGWACLLAYPFIIGVPLREELVLKYFLHTCLLAGFFYTNVFILIPRMLAKGKFGFYLLFVFSIIAVIVGLNLYFNKLFEIDLRMAGDVVHRHGLRHPEVTNIKRIARPFFSSLFILAVSTSYKLLLDWFKTEREKKEIENENLVSELSFLKSQVSPHFLFNTLNNIYSLSLSNSELTSDAILKLSQLLRYMLYESNVKEVALQKEIDYLKTYIELQKMRLRNDVPITFKTEGSFSGKHIQPMLLIPFIENAFKHGVNYAEKSYVTVDISLKDDILLMKIENPIHTKNKAKDENSGIGLSNVKRRLDLLYPEKHQLDIKEQPSQFIVELTLNLN